MLCMDETCWDDTPPRFVMHSMTYVYFGDPNFQWAF